MVAELPAHDAVAVGEQVRAGRHDARPRPGSFAPGDQGGGGAVGENGGSHHVLLRKIARQERQAAAFECGDQRPRPGMGPTEIESAGEPRRAAGAAESQIGRRVVAASQLIDQAGIQEGVAWPVEETQIT